MIKCACGCGALIEPLDSKNRPRKYVLGHATRVRKYPSGFFDYMKGNQYGFKKGSVPWNKGKKRPEMAGENNPFYGKKHTKETRAKMSGTNNGNWKGGVSSTNLLIRKSVEYLDWKASVFIRDGRACVWCGSTERIEADHIKPFSTHPELRFDINNGRTLCHECHRTTETYGNKKK